MSTATTSDSGRLVVVGTGLQPARHAPERVLSEVRRADVVFSLCDAFTLDWLGDLHDDVRNLCEYYGDDLDRRHSYAAMQDAMLAEVRAGRRVAAAFYGHPGVFAQVGHAAIAMARREGFDARMEPGISAEACLYADLGMDPGECGAQSFETTQFLVQQRTLDPASLVLLWQVALAGNLDCVGFEPDSRRLAVLVDKLLRWYAADTPAILYEAATLPIVDHRAERIALGELAEAELNQATTLVIPPAVKAEPDRGVRDRLESIG